MANLQKTFKNSYVSQLKDQVRAELSLDKYSGETFDVDESQVRFLANVYQPEGLLERMMNAESDFEAAIHLYKAYKNISPLLASTEAFWTYLTHTELLPYCQKRWPNVMIGAATRDYILDHWFISGNGIMRNTLASLWLSVYFSIDETKDNPYELTEILFKNYSFRVLWFSIFLRIKNGLLGVLEFIKDNRELLDHSFENRGRYIASHINRLGAVRNLSYLPKEFFYNECERIKDNIFLIETREDLKEMLGQTD